MEPMRSDVNDVMQMETDRLRALVDRDTDAAARFHADDYQLVTPNGSTLTKAAYLAAVASRDLEYLAFEPVSPIAAIDSADVIVLRYEALIRLQVGVDDELQFEAWHTDVYERQTGGWQVVWSQATRIT